ncbi:MAG TPA: hypothetical protein VLG41_14720 [Hydrogenophaga sp.]|uniref:hypothetical protein n=1 Tax=Hydrogenophaga sp. TaxID=1904254 RepID=UPI002C497748|nr:hypothetical protein [Hydrogenophaga sp.]HSX94178.1 hypothetical protein [Hydrogenophaga sp.]
MDHTSKPVKPELPQHLSANLKRVEIMHWFLLAGIGAAILAIVNLYNGAYLHIRVHEVDRIESIELNQINDDDVPYFSDRSLVTFDNTTGNAYFVVAPARKGSQELRASVFGKAGARQLTCTIDVRSWRCFSEVFISPDRMACTACTRD